MIAAALALGFLAQPALARATEPTTIELFKREGCPHCVEAREYLGRLVERRPGEVRLVVHDVARDELARERMIELCEAAGIRTIGVPTILVEGTVLVGFTPGDTDARIEQILRGDDPAPKSIRLPLIGVLRPDEIGLPLFTLAIGLVDGLNPCAMWVLLFLLAILVNLKSRTKMLAIGGVFVAVSGVVYFAFMAAWLNLFLFVGVSRPITIGLGLVALVVGAINIKDFVALGKGLSIGIPDAAKPGIYGRARRILSAEHLSGALAAVVVLAFLVNLVELLCTAGLPAVYTAVLTAQGLPPWQYYAYLGLYMIAYMFDDAVMLGIAVVTLSKHKLQQRGARVLKLVSGSVMFGLGAILVARPQWLGW